MVSVAPKFLTQTNRNIRQYKPTSSQTLQEAFIESYTVSEDFVSFRLALLSFWENQYCNSCTVDPMNFVFGVWFMGVFMVSIGVVFVFTCPVSLIVSSYLIVDGTLTVFYYPLLLVHSEPKIGSSKTDDFQEEQEDAEDSKWWLAVLLVRHFTLFMWSIFLPIFHTSCFLNQHRNDQFFPNFCRASFPIALATVLFSWVYLLYVIIPYLFCMLLYQLAPVLLANNQR